MEAHVVNLRAVLCRQLHALSVKAAVDANVFVGTAFLDIYAKSELIEKASCILKVVSFVQIIKSLGGGLRVALLEGRKWGLMQSVYDINSDMYAKCGAIKEAYAVSCDIERIGCCLVECDDF
ncbi:hypothetical protein OIU74_021469 [Salix koriyanagi]|uniref:Uncharacterized protein n=1 Tax=Salix koriyanagi TaxID=2511006 RepID=A0A9Q1ADV9_9ROSI|nr:hypothetical protein OIU74_021469 [Salix koriyanagi]